MEISRYYIKKLTVAEANTSDNNVHEIYIRLTNDFDYKEFFQTEGYINDRNARQIDFKVSDITFSEHVSEYDMKFVYYENSNKEKRIPSMASIFNSRGIKAGDIICLESRSIDGKTSFYLTFNKANTFPMSSDSMYYSVTKGNICQMDLYKRLTTEQRESVFSYFIENLEERKVGNDQIKKYAHTYIPHIDKYVSKIDGYNTLYDIVSIDIFKKVGVLASKDSNPDPNYAGAYQSSYNKYGRLLEELLSPQCRIDLKQFGAKTETNEDGKKTHLQQIYYGAPGTGKSHTINEKTEGESVIRTTFHPDSDYSTFVGAYKPTMGLLPICDELGQPMKIGSAVLHKEQIIYEFVDQAFLQAYVQAWKFYAENADDAKKQFLIIEEINRGNCAQIFGDLFQLLDRNDNGFSVYPINADKDMKKQLEKALKGLSIEGSGKINALYKGKDVVSQVLSGDILLLPNNLYIWATMNTSDQSLFPIDSAFKRRWEWQYMPIGKGYDENGQEIKWAIEGATKKYSWWSFLEKINAQIAEATQSEDKKLGFFFCKATDNVISAEKFVGKVIFYLWNDVFKNNGFEGPIFKDVDGTELSFGKFYKSDLKGNAIVQKDKVELFLTNLGVEIVEEDYDEEYEDGEEYEDEGARVSDTNAPYRVTFPDGEIICEGSGWETYVATLQKIGLEKALPFGEMYSRLNKTLPLITKKKIADQGVYKYYEVDGYYVLSGTDSQHRLLKRMNKDLNLGLTIE